MFLKNELVKKHALKQAKKWERRWVLQQNVIENGEDIWLQKWICVDPRGRSYEEDFANVHDIDLFVPPLTSNCTCKSIHFCR